MSENYVEEPSPRLPPELLGAVLEWLKTDKGRDHRVHVRASRASYTIGLPYLWRLLKLYEIDDNGDPTPILERVRGLLAVGRRRDSLRFVRRLHVDVETWFPELDEFLVKVLPHTTYMHQHIPAAQLSKYCICTHQKGDKYQLGANFGTLPPTSTLPW